MSAVRVNIKDNYQANSMKMKGLMFSVEIESKGNGDYFLYGSPEKIKSCLVGLTSATVKGEYDAIESKLD